ncbi:MAG: sugar-binding transcriptional regulator [Anaerolineae bacterium]|nr:sugar-binding transcriptional regulator [Anaerolineae bacterium]
MYNETRQLVRVATLYYKHQLLQSEIAERVGVSRQTVGRLLQRANELGLVKVEIQQPFAYATDLELRLEQVFGLTEAIVAVPLDDDDATTKAAIGGAAATFVQERVRDGDILGLSSGSTTLYECALRIKAAQMPNLTVVSLTGSAPHNFSTPNVDLSVMLIGQALGGRTVLLPAPRFVDTAEIKTSLINDSGIASVLRLGCQANIMLLGVGVISEDSTTYRDGYFTKDLLESMYQRGAVGEILGHAFDEKGVRRFPEICDRSVGIEPECVRGKSMSVAVAGGAAKVESLWGAIQGAYFNILITDSNAARGLLELAERRGVAPRTLARVRKKRSQ